MKIVLEKMFLHLFKRSYLENYGYYDDESDHTN